MPFKINELYGDQMKGKDIDQFELPQDISEPRSTREKIIEAVIEGKPITEGKKKMVVIPPSGSAKADFNEVVDKFNIPSDSSQYQIVQIFCEKKKASASDTKVLIQRIESLNPEQMEIFEVVCQGDEFTAKNLLSVIPPIKRFENERILVLHAFVDLGEVSPGSLGRFFITALPQSKPEDVGREAYENELIEKRMTLDQINVFYNICNRVPGVTFETAISALPKTRLLKPQHAQILNTFLKKDSCFGEKPITDKNIIGLIKLWLGLEELTEWSRYEKLVKTISKKSNKKKSDFKYIVQLYKKTLEAANGSSRGKLVSGFKRFLK